MEADLLRSRDVVLFPISGSPEKMYLKKSINTKIIVTLLKIFEDYIVLGNYLG